MVEPTHRLVVSLHWRIEQAGSPRDADGVMFEDSTLIPPNRSKRATARFIRERIEAQTKAALDQHYPL